MDLIPLVQQALIVVAITFAVVLIISYIYAKFFKKEKEEIQPAKTSNSNKPSAQTSEVQRRTFNYTASSDAEKLYVNTEEHRKHIVTNKVASKPKRFKVLNKTEGDEE